MKVRPARSAETSPWCETAHASSATLAARPADAAKRSRDPGPLINTFRHAAEFRGDVAARSCKADTHIVSGRRAKHPPISAVRLLDRCWTSSPRGHSAWLLTSQKLL